VVRRGHCRQQFSWMSVLFWRFGCLGPGSSSLPLDPVRYHSQPAFDATWGCSVIEFALISAIYIGALAPIFGWSPWRGSYPAIPTEMARVLTAAERASLGAMRRRLGAVAAAIGSVSGVVLLAHLLFGWLGSSVSSLTSGIVASLAVVWGAALAWGCASFCIRAGARSSARLFATCSESLDAGLVATIRASSSMVLTLEVAATIAVSLCFVVLYAFGHGLATSPTESYLFLKFAARQLPYVGVGVAIVALSSQQSANAYRAGLRLGGNAAARIEAQLEPDDPRNPSAVVELIAVQYGQLVPRMLDAVLTSVVATSVAIVFGLLLAGPADPETSTVLLWAPLTIRAFGLISTVFGVLSIRTEEERSPLSAFFRGEAVAIFVLFGAIAGTGVWLLPEHRMEVVAAGAVGTALTVLVGHLARRLLAAHAERSTRGTRRGLASLVVSEASEFAMRLALMPIVVFAAATGGLYALSLRLPGNGSTLVLVVAVFGATAYTLLSQCATATGPVVDMARISANLVQAKATDDVTRRLSRLRTASAHAGSSGLVAGYGSTCLLALLVALTLPRLSTNSSSGLSLVVLIVAASFAFVPFLITLAASVHVSGRAARTLWTEVERQLLALPRQADRVVVPTDFAPSYRSCVELVARAASRGGLGALVVVVAVPLVFSLALARISKTPGLMAQALACYVVVAAVAGLAATVAVDGARLALWVGRRLQAPRSQANPSAPGGVSADGVLDVAGHTVSLAFPPLVKTAALIALCIVPFFS